MKEATTRRLAWGGIAGPAAFVLGWSLAGARWPDYSPVEDPISRLAGAGAPTKVAMTTGFIAFGVGVGVYSAAAASALSRATAAASAVAAAATFGIAVLPLDTPRGGGPHATAAGFAYAALATTQLAGARALANLGYRTAARMSAFTGVATAVALAASAAASSHTGLLQRVGLTIGDAWIAATAIWIVPRRPTGKGRAASLLDRP
jgi:hypothetical membrane protein